MAALGGTRVSVGDLDVSEQGAAGPVLPPSTLAAPARDAGAVCSEQDRKGRDMGQEVWGSGWAAQGVGRGCL